MRNQGTGPLEFSQGAVGILPERPTADGAVVPAGLVPVRPRCVSSLLRFLQSALIQPDSRSTTFGCGLRYADVPTHQLPVAWDQKESLHSKAAFVGLRTP